MPSHTLKLQLSVSLYSTNWPPLVELRLMQHNKVWPNS